MTNFDEQKHTLEIELQTLTKELSELGIHNPEIGEDWIATPRQSAATEADDNLVADRAEDWIEARAEVAELETRYNNVVRALQKIEAGTYGTCEICQQPIEPERLTANPAARTCMTHINETPQ